MQRVIISALFILAFVILAGCGKNAAADKKAPPSEKPDGGKPAEVAGTHEGWWCDEHGVPEEECSLCSAKVAAECKKKGDWCDKHDRAKSQCFICDPVLKEKFAARYRAKYGKEPPAIENEDKRENKENKKE